MSNQLVKKNPTEGYQNVFPKTFIDAIKDKESGVSLQEILQGFNMYFLSYNGSRALTRCKVPSVLRKEGLWITYVLYDHTVVTEWYNSDQIDDNSWSMDSNWRVASNFLVGDVSVSADGYWVINGEKTEARAQGEQGVTPLLRVGTNNKLQVSYNAGKAWKDISDYIVPRFKWNQGVGTTAGTIQISMDLGKTWTNLSNEITNNLRIFRYIGTNESLPTSGVAEGTIYMKGPYYNEGDTSHANPIYRMWIYAWKGNTLAWQDNGEFTSISAGVVQESGNSTTEVMSQDAVTKELTKLDQLLLQGYLYKGVAKPTDNPGTPLTRVFYIAREAGTYEHFDSIVVPADVITVLKYDILSKTWSIENTGIATVTTLKCTFNEKNGFDLSYGHVSTKKIASQFQIDFLMNSTLETISTTIGVDNAFVHAQNWIRDYSGYAITSEIPLKAGDIIQTTTHGGGQNVSCIAVKDNDGLYRSVVNYIDYGIENHFFTAIEDCSVVVSYNKSYTIDVYKISSEPLSQISNTYNAAKTKSLETAKDIYKIDNYPLTQGAVTSDGRWGSINSNYLHRAIPVTPGQEIKINGVLYVAFAKTYNIMDGMLLPCSDTAPYNVRVSPSLVETSTFTVPNDVHWLILCLVWNGTPNQLYKLTIDGVDYLNSYPKKIDVIYNNESVSIRNKNEKETLLIAESKGEYAPANTLEHFMMYRKLGFKYLKADIRITSDNELVCWHSLSYKLNEIGKAEESELDTDNLISSITLNDFLALECAADGNMYQNIGDYYPHPIKLEDFLVFCIDYNVTPFLTLRTENYEATVPVLMSLLKQYGFFSTAIINVAPYNFDAMKLVRDVNPFIKIAASFGNNAAFNDKIERISTLGNVMLSIGYEDFTDIRFTDSIARLKAHNIPVIGNSIIYYDHFKRAIQNGMEGGLVSFADVGVYSQNTYCFQIKVENGNIDTTFDFSRLGGKRYTADLRKDGNKVIIGNIRLYGSSNIDGILPVWMNCLPYEIIAVSQYGDSYNAIWNNNKIEFETSETDIVIYLTIKV